MLDGIEFGDLIRNVILIYIGVMTLVGFIVMKVDKVKAIKHKWRVSEKSLLTLAFIGGGIGAIIGMYCFRHKTRRLKFNLLFPVAALIYMLIIIAIL